MNTLTHFEHWNNLPIEIKMESVKNLDSNSRLALRSCSLDDWKLVESVPFRKIHWLYLTEVRSGYRILLKENVYSRTVYEFENFEEFQEKLLKILDNAEYIENLSIILKNTMKTIKMMPRNQKIKVKKLTLNMHRPEDFLQQFDATILKKIYLESSRTQILDGLYDLPQFNSVDELQICSDSIRDDQLMKMKSKKFMMLYSGELTANGIFNYIKKRTSEPNFEELTFARLDEDLLKAVVETTFQSHQSDHFVHPSFPEFNTNIGGSREISMRRIRTNSTPSSNFKIVEHVKIGDETSGGRYHLDIGENFEENPVSFEAREKTQESLSERMANISYIKRLEVNLMRQNNCWRFVPEGSLNQITVGHLKIRCNETNGQLAINLLKQIEPRYLKCVELYGENIPNNVYDMQQMIQADYIESSHSNIQDHQLMKLSATKMIFGMYRNQITEHGRITAPGANKFIKKCLLDLNKRNYDFVLVPSYKCEYREFVSTLLEELDIFSMKNDQEIDEEFHQSEVIVNSDWKGFKLKLDIDEKYLKGTRIDV